MDSLTELYKEMSEEELDYVSVPKPRIEKKKHYDPAKAHTYLQLQLAELEPLLCWTTATLEKDRPRLYSLSTQFSKVRGESKLMSILQWAREKRVHVRALFKVLTRELKVMNSI